MEIEEGRDLKKIEERLWRLDKELET